MAQNVYDEPEFFEKYSRMGRSLHGLEGAGEWHELKKLFPDFVNKRVLDLGCGYGWHCRYAAEKGAQSVLGIDLSERMLAEARSRTESESVRYLRMPIEEIDFPENSFDAVISSLALHYVASFADLLKRVARCLTAGGVFVFSVEHPVFTAQGPQEWVCDARGNRLYWPVDRYFAEGRRRSNFLGEEVVKYHRTLTTYLNSLIGAGFEITGVVEPEPAEHLLSEPGMADELRRPMMLLVSARKK